MSDQDGALCTFVIKKIIWRPAYGTMLNGMVPDDSLALSLFNLRAQHRFGVLQDESGNEGGIQDDRTFTVGYG